MTSFAAQTGGAGLYEWTWDLRSVNGRGLDLRLRIPDWIIGLEPVVKGKLSKSLARGSVQLSLRVTRAETAAAAGINDGALRELLANLAKIESEAMAADVSVVAPSTIDLLNARGIQETTVTDSEAQIAALAKALADDFDGVLVAFGQGRAQEGGALHKILTGQIDEIERLTHMGAEAAELRKEAQAETLRSNVARVLENADGVDADRLAQELALLAVKSDITEEIDRLHAHVAAARALLGADGPVGRKLDFLTQEFNREANTLCSKAQSSALTAIGLDLKATIDQMREQVQNVE